MGSYRIKFWLPPEAIGLMNPWMSNNSANTYFFSFKPTTNYWFFQTWTSVIQQFPSVTPTPSARTPSVLTVARAKLVLLETEKNVSVSWWNDFHCCLKQFILKQSKTKTIPAWSGHSIKKSCFNDRLELYPTPCHVQLLIRRDAFASNRHFRSTLALEFKPFSFLCILSDVDECANKSHDCDVNAYCNNTVGSYRCSFNSWYQGNGTSCYFGEFN